MMTERPDLYTILNLTPQATQDQISHAYRTLLHRHHPDTRAPADQAQNLRSDATLQDVLAAYAVLGDRVRRAAYDRQLPSRPRPAPQPRKTTYTDRTPRQPPIVAGPVRWRPARTKPHQ